MRRRFVVLLVAASLTAFAPAFIHPFGAMKDQVSVNPLFDGATIDAAIGGIFEKSCQNCHSERTEWPWYSYTAPMSWMLESDVRQARSRMNLSRWREYSPEEQQQLLAKISVMIRSRAMPLPRYVLLHPGARLSDDEIAQIAQWTKTERRRLKRAGSQQ